MRETFKGPGRAHAEAHRITVSSDAELHEYIHRGIKSVGCPVWCAGSIGWSNAQLHTTSPNVRCGVLVSR